MEKKKVLYDMVIEARDYIKNLIDHNPDVAIILGTGAEYRMLRTMGADVVGMSTVPEVIVARHMGMRILGLSVITDMGLPDAMESVNLEDVISAASRTEPFLTTVITKIVERI